jgi:hypothetical protein
MIPALEQCGQRRSTSDRPGLPILPHLPLSPATTKEPFGESVSEKAHLRRPWTTNEMKRNEITRCGNEDAIVSGARPRVCGIDQQTRICHEGRVVTADCRRSKNPSTQQAIPDYSQSVIVITKDRRTGTEAVAMTTTFHR